MRFKTIQEIVDTLQLDACATDIAAVKRELRARRAAIHPDRLSGHEQSEAQKAEWRNLEAAMEFIDSVSADSTAMIRLDDLQHITDTLAASLAVIHKPQVEDRQEKAVERSRQSIQGKYLLPKLTVGSLAGIMGVLLTVIGILESSALFYVPLENIPLRIHAPDFQIIMWDTGALLSTVDEYLTGHASQADLAGVKGPQDAVARFNLEYLPPVIPALLKRATLYLWPDTLHPLASMEDAILSPPAEDVAISQFSQLETDIKRYTQALPIVFREDLTIVGEIQKRTNFLRQRLIGIQSSLSTAYRVRLDEKECSERDKKVRVVIVLWKLFAGTVLILLFVWFRERSDQRWVEFLATDAALGVSLKRLAAEKCNGPAKQWISFRKDEFAAIVCRKNTSRFLTPLFGSSLDSSRVTGVVITLLERMIQRGWIRRLPDQGLAEWYMVAKSGMVALGDAGSNDIA